MDGGTWWAAVYGVAQSRTRLSSSSSSSICGFPGSSAAEEFTCSAADPGLIPGLGSSSGEGTSYPLQCSWASLVPQTVTNPMQKTWVQSLGWEDPLEEGIATHSSIAWRVTMDRGAWWATVHGVKKSQTRLSD